MYSFQNTKPVGARFPRLGMNLPTNGAGRPRPYPFFLQQTTNINFKRIHTQLGGIFLAQAAFATGKNRL